MSDKKTKKIQIVFLDSILESKKYSYTNILVNESIPDGQVDGLSHSVEIQGVDVTLDHVEVLLNIPGFLGGGMNCFSSLLYIPCLFIYYLFTYFVLADLRITLTSPSNTTSVLTEEHAFRMYAPFNLLYIALT
jgi:hypothetical protein